MYVSKFRLWFEFPVRAKLEFKINILKNYCCPQCINLNHYLSGWLGAMSTSVSLFISPLVIGLCRRKSTRLTAVMGGLITALGCLFTSFASHFHHLFWIPLLLRHFPLLRRSYFSVPFLKLSILWSATKKWRTKFEKTWNYSC